MNVISHVGIDMLHGIKTRAYRFTVSVSEVFAERLVLLSPHYGKTNLHV